MAAPAGLLVEVETRRREASRSAAMAMAMPSFLSLGKRGESAEGMEPGEAGSQFVARSQRIGSCRGAALHGSEGRNIDLENRPVRYKKLSYKI